LTLVELLIVVALVGIFAVAILGRWQSTLYDRARAVAQIVVADVAYARNLAVANNSSYRITFDVPDNRYVLTHSGSDTAYDALPPSPYGSPEDTATTRTTVLSALPGTGGAVSLVAAHRLTPIPQPVEDLEFGPLGQSQRSEPTRIWLAAGAAAARRYLAVDVNPITGLAAIGQFQTELPPAAVPIDEPTAVSAELDSGSP
jgi:type II secretory pathway pseudopilin PulG